MNTVLSKFPQDNFQFLINDSNLQEIDLHET